MESHGLYVYGLVRAAGAPELGEVGLDYRGRPARVHPVAVGDVAAIVSAYERERRVLPLRRNLEPHHRVIRELAEACTVVPMTFGHVARSEREVTSVLRRNAAGIRAELDRLEGKVEMGLKIQWDVPNIYKHIVEADTGLAELRDRVFREAAPGQADKIELGRRFEERLRSERASLAERALEALGAEVAETRTNAPTTEEAVADLAFLVDRRLQKRFEERVGEVASAWPAQYVFRCSGPRAPFNFVDLQLETGQSRANR
jgi:Gas vesicle synthesis protein GvpL/GvpF